MKRILFRVVNLEKGAITASNLFKVVEVDNYVPDNEQEVVEENPE